jgi:hypothetical protein
VDDSFLALHHALAWKCLVAVVRAAHNEILDAGGKISVHGSALSDLARLALALMQHGATTLFVAEAIKCEAMCCCCVVLVLGRALSAPFSLSCVA